MAPEYVEHQRADAGSDQFSLGVVAWESLAGRRLFRGPTEIETLKRVVSTRVPSLAELEPLLAAVEPSINRALARASSDRFATVREFADALESSARSVDLVATHAEVGKAVEHLLHDELRERRHTIRTAPEGEDAGAVLSGLAVRARDRDAMPTGSIVAPGVRSSSSATSGTTSGASFGRRSWIAVVAASALGMTAGAGVLLASRGARAPRVDRAAAEQAPSMAAVEAPIEGPGETPSEVAPSASNELPVGASSTSPPPSAPSRPRANAGAGRRVAPPSGLVPRKAPPNPYVR
jgi:serine/threonine-protein kinase